MCTNKSYFYYFISVMNMSDQAESIVYDLKPGTIILDHLRFRKIT